MNIELGNLGINVGILIAILVPILLLQLGLLAFALIDLVKRDEAELRHMPKLGWGIVIVLINFVGPVLYLLLGREES